MNVRAPCLIVVKLRRLVRVEVVVNKIATMPLKERYNTKKYSRTVKTSSVASSSVVTSRFSTPTIVEVDYDRIGVDRVTRY